MEPVRKTVVLLKKHTHGGVQLNAGALLSLDARTADWLVEQGMAKAKDGAALLQRPAQPRIRRSCCGG